VLELAGQKSLSAVIDTVALVVGDTACIDYSIVADASEVAVSVVVRKWLSQRTSTETFCWHQTEHIEHENIEHFFEIMKSPAASTASVDSVASKSEGKQSLT